MRGGWRAGMLTLVLAVGGGALAVPGAEGASCGGLLQPPCPPPPTTPTPPPAPAPAPPITTVQYTALDSVLGASAALESDSAGAAEEQAYTSACNGLDQGDALLAAYRKACRADIASGTRADTFGNCRTLKQCRKAGSALITALRAFPAAIRRFDKAVGTATTDAECGAALRVSGHDVRVFDAIASALTAAIHAAFTKGTADDRKASKRIKAVDTSGLRSSTDQYTAFQAGCR